MSALSAEIARRLALQVADVRPNADLLRLGHGATLVRLDPGSAVLSDAEGSAALTPELGIENGGDFGIDFGRGSASMYRRTLAAG